MRHTARICLSLLAVLPALPKALAVEDPAPKVLGMTTAIACASISGLDDYVALKDAVITPDDKLLFYYQPLDYHVEKAGKEYRARLSVDGALRKKGSKKILNRKADVIKYEPLKPTSKMYLYFSHVISAKGLPPGDYELEITLHDRIAPEATATQIVPFRVKAAAPAAKTP